MYIDNEKGFTLPEILSAVVILAILAAVGIPTLLNWMPGIRLKSAANDLMADMQQAKIVAIRNNNTTNLVFAAGCDAAGNYTFTDGNGVVIVNKPMQNGICINVSGVNPFPVTFNSRGIPVGGAGGAVLMTHPNAARQYIITQTVAGGVNLQ